MKKRVLTIVLLLACSLGFAQTKYDGEQYFQFNPRDYMSNMPCRFEIYVNGVIQTSNQYEIGAFVGDAIRASAGLTEREGYAHPVYEVQIYGDGITETFTFKIYDHSSNTLYDYISSEIPWNMNGYGTTPATVGRIDFYQPATCTFTGTGDWSDASRWSPRVPVTCDDAIIAAGAICTVDDDATVEYSTLTIKDGAQFYAEDGTFNNATVEKYIAAYTGTRDNYYFIANPTEADFLNTTNLLTGDFDLYFWTVEGLDEEEDETMEWQNYKSTTYANHEDFAADFGGYLYANAANTTLGFTGTLNNAEGTTYTLPATAGENFTGFHLLANPYPCNVSVTGGTSITGYYTLNEGRNEVISVSNPVVGPCTSFFGVATTGTAAKRKVTLTPTTDDEANTRSIANSIAVEVNNAEGALLDRAYVKFGEGENLKKLTINPDATHIFVRQNGLDYANAFANDLEQLPLYFETKEYGEYTINVKLENMNCEYLHLIDNLTGNDVDLNATPYYTFTAHQSDYASRFKIVFRGTGVEEENVNTNFAIVEGNRLVIPEVENGSNLQIIDMAGRIISNQKVSGSVDMNLNVTAGIYIVRLNGNTQKIVVR